MDGQFHAIEFDPSATATEVLKLVKAKIGLRDNAQGSTVWKIDHLKVPFSEKNVLPSTPLKKCFLV
jgi:hypothetical protein